MLPDLPLPILSSYFDYRDRSLTTGAASIAINILTPNANRWAIMWGHGGSAPMWFSPFRALVLNDGYTIPAGGGVVIMDFRALGSLIQAEWFFATNAAGVGQTLHCVEVLYNPPHAGQVSQ